MKRAVILFVLLVVAAAPAAAASTDYAHAQVDNMLAQLNITNNLLGIFNQNLEENARSLAYISINQTVTGTWSQKVFREYMAAANNSTACATCAGDLEEALRVVGDNASEIYGTSNGSAGIANVTKEKIGYRTGEVVDELFEVLERYTRSWVEWKKQTYEALGIGVE